MIPGLDASRITSIVTAKGKVTGSRITFGGEMPASAIKASLKEANPELKGNALAKKVNEVLTGRTTMAWAEADVMMSAARSLGYIPNTGAFRSKTGEIRFVKPTPVKEKKAKITKESVAAMSKAERDELIKLLLA